VSNPERLLISATLGLIASLLVVGSVSSTFVRHLIQLAPTYVLLYGSFTHRAWVRAGAVPVFAFWLFIVGAIWCFLLGVAHIVSGTFSTTERVMTGTMALSAICGLTAVARSRESAGWTSRLAGFLVLAALQWAAFWLSLQPAFAHR
jgi:hypothetical protein